jgi:hypothetical protein
MQIVTVFTTALFVQFVRKTLDDVCGQYRGTTRQSSFIGRHREDFVASLSIRFSIEALRCSVCPLGRSQQSK